MTPQAYIGASCNTQADCARDPETTVCTYAFAAPGEQGTCLHPCGADGACPALGGVPHTCIGKSATVPGVCFPGVFGAPCASDASCTPGLTCRDLGPAKVCTTLCQKDGDCEANRWTAVEDELRAMLEGIVGATLVRRHRIALIAAQAYNIGAELARDPANAVLLPHVGQEDRTPDRGQYQQQHDRQELLDPLSWTQRP